MVAARLPTTIGRRLQRVCLQAQQKRWAQVHDVRFLVTTQAPLNIVEKYREKLARKAQEEGLRDINELKAAYADRVRELKKKDSITVPGLDALLGDEEPPSPTTIPSSSPSSTTTNTSTITTTSSSSSSRPKKTPPKSTTSQGAVKPLDEILDLPKARALPVEELTTIWRLRHAAVETSLCAVIPTATYQSLERTARRHPTFVLPVPRDGQGAEIHFLQWVFDAVSGTSSVLFTQLAEYKARGEWAQPHTTITHYPDYGHPREQGDGEKPVGVSHPANQGVVLMAGSLVEKRGASILDARWLVMLLQRFYAEEGMGGDAAKRKLLEAFGRGDGDFSVEKLLEECEKLG